MEFFEPQQIALSDAGSARLVHCIRLLAEMEVVKQEDQGAEDQFGPWQEEIVGIKIDVKNAFNTCSPTAIISALEEENSLKHMAWAVACQLGPEQPLESGGKRWGTKKTGAT